MSGKIRWDQRGHLVESMTDRWPGGYLRRLAITQSVAGVCQGPLPQGRLRKEDGAWGYQMGLWFLTDYLKEKVLNVVTTCWPVHLLSTTSLPSQDPTSQQEWRPWIKKKLGAGNKVTWSCLSSCCHKHHPPLCNYGSGE